LAVKDGVLRVREKKFKACELGMVNNFFFLKIGRQNSSVDDQGWQDTSNFYITNVKQVQNPNDFVNTTSIEKSYLMLRLQ